MSFEFQYLSAGSSQISEILAGLIKGSRGSFGQDISLKICVGQLRESLFRDQNPSKYQMLIDHDWHEILVYMLESCYRKENMELLIEVLYLLITITNNSEDICLALVNINFHDVLIQHTLRYSRDQGISDISRQLTHSYMVIIFNIVRVDKFRTFFHENPRMTQLKKVILPLITMGDEDNKITALLVIALLNKGEKKDKKLLCGHTCIVDSIADYISKAMTDENREFRGYNVWVLLLGLQSLSILRAMKFKIIKTEKLMKVLIKIISTDPFKVKEVEVVLQILTHLCDEAEIRHVLYDLNSVILKVSADNKGSIKIIADSIISKLQKNPPEIKYEEHREYDACFSYSFEDRDIIRRIENALKNKVKIYVGRGNESDLNSADFDDVIRRSKVVIIGSSMSYQNNQRCIMEAIKVTKAKKPIITLELIHKFRPSKLFSEIVNRYEIVDFSDNAKFDYSVKNLYDILIGNMSQPCRTPQSNQPQSGHCSDNTTKVEALKLRSTEADVELKSNKIHCQKDISTSSNKTEILEPSQCEEDNFKDWTQEKVSQWLTSNRLSGIHNNFHEFNGELLQKLKDLKKSAQKYYYNQLKKSLGLTLTEILRFDSALEKLTIPDKNL